mmetsp:Transcript_19797/g.33126  ORF Transcript_19797/g.33126 Transcript_19797/m.33126 type:complete len:539 (+) Transcript_19797:100-1716(+)
MLIRDPLISAVIITLSFCVTTHAQFRNDTSQYALTLKAETESLQDEIKLHPDVAFFFDPEIVLINRNSYIFDFPESANYRIGIIVDPCRFNSYDCCMNIFGMPEYAALLSSDLEAERVFKYEVIADPEEVSSNYFVMDEDSNPVATEAIRSADDSALFNLSCVSDGNPASYCSGRNFAYTRSALRPPCLDNNSTLDVMSGCVAPNGTELSSCVAVGFTSNDFIPQCNDDAGDHCGTYLEIHMAHGTPYQAETDVIAEVKIDVRNVSGYYTTVLPMTWMKNDSKILCSYSESELRIGSLVYIKDTAPVCCCPPPFTSETRVGSFQCPRGATSNGALAYRSKTLADVLNTDTLLLDYPFCPIDLTVDEDLMMCSAYDVGDRRHYTRNCTTIFHRRPREVRSWGSIDLDGEYDGQCPYYDSCGLTLDLGKCRLDDLRFTFIGMVGIVTALDNEAVIPQVWVTFNDGRTSYQFSQGNVKLETTPKSMYEIWWVVRSPSEFTVQKRKGFNVTSPQCTFDTTNNRYYPYTILRNGLPLDNSLTP